MRRLPPPRTLALFATALVLLALVVGRTSGGPSAALPLTGPADAAAIVGAADEDAAWQAMTDLGRAGDRSAAPLAMRTLTTHPSPRVRAAAANALSRLEVWDSMPALLQAMADDPEARVRTQANLAVAKLVGFQYSGYDPDGSAADRAQAIQYIRSDYPQRLGGHLDWLKRRGIDPEPESP